MILSPLQPASKVDSLKSFHETIADVTLELREDDIGASPMLN